MKSEALSRDEAMKLCAHILARFDGSEGLRRLVIARRYHALMKDRNSTFWDFETPLPKPKKRPARRGPRVSELKT